MKTARLAWLALGLTVAAITANAEPESNRSDNDSATRTLSGDRADYSWRDLSGRRFNFTDGSQIRGEAERASSRSAAAVAAATTPSAVAAPEIDPASAASGLTLLLGGIAVLRSRRKPVGR
jgi:hypothetical protein